MTRYSVRIDKDNLLFCSAHFISFEGHRCERLHGHNYRAAIEIEGPLDPVDRYVVDFIALKARAMEIVADLDHRMLLASENPIIRIHHEGTVYRVACNDREWRFPTGDCVLLPIANTTAEEIARYFAERLLNLLRDRHNFQPTRLRLEIEENVGQSGIFETTFSG